MINVAGNVALQNVLTTLEIERKKIAATQKKGYLFIAIGIIVAITGFVLGLLVPAAIAGFVSLIYGGIILYKISGELKTYEEAFKIQVIGTALKSLDDSLVIEPYKGISADEFEDMQIFSESPDRYRTEDLVSGKADKTAFILPKFMQNTKRKYKQKMEHEPNGTTFLEVYYSAQTLIKILMA